MTKSLVWLDDDYEYIGGLIERLTEPDYRITKLRTYSEAMNNLETILASDLIILDILLPLGGSVKTENESYLGLRLLEKLQDEMNYRRPVIACTVVRQVDIHTELQKRASTVLSKPATTARILKQEVEKLL